MFGNNREDDLLNKLKNCIGSLKGETVIDRSVETRMKNHYNTLKQNHTGSDTHPLQAMNYHSFNQSIVLPRQPLTIKNNINDPPISAYPPNRYIKQDLQTFAPPERQRSYDSKAFEPTPRKFQYPMPVDRFDRESQPTTKLQSYDSTHQNSQGIKGELARRYSHIQPKAQPKHHQIQSHTSRPTTNYAIQKSQDRGLIRNYQRQVEERKEILEDRPLHRVEHNEKHFKQPIFGNIKRQLIPQQNEMIRPQQPPIQDYPSRKNSQNSAAKEAIRKEYEQQGSRECSALGKLRKISQLNQKINQRIRNIINVFEQNKC